MLIFLVRASEGLFYRSSLFFLPVYFKEVLSLDIKQSGFLTSVVLGGGVLGQISGGFLADRIGNKRTLLLFFIIDALLIFLIPFSTFGIGAVAPSIVGLVADIYGIISIFDYILYAALAGVLFLVVLNMKSVKSFPKS